MQPFDLVEKMSMDGHTNSLPSKSKHWSIGKSGRGGTMSEEDECDGNYLSFDV